MVRPVTHVFYSQNAHGDWDVFVEECGIEEWVATVISEELARKVVHWMKQDP